MLADNRIAQGAGWDRKLLALEFPELTPLLQAEDLDIGITVEPPEIDQILIDLENDNAESEEELDPTWNSDRVVSQQGDLWRSTLSRLVLE